MDHTEQLRDAFRSHEHLAPDALVVSAAARELGRRHLRRRRAAQAAGGAALTVGLAVGVAVLPSALSDGTPSTLQVAAAPPSAAAVSPLAAAQDKKAYDAYFAAGYDFDDAMELARLWDLDDSAGDPDPYGTKAVAGRRLLAGEDLPIAPGAGPAPAAVPRENPDDDPEVAFLAAGYDWQDAVTLARMWGSRGGLEDSEVLQVKAEAGQKLLDGETLPIRP